MEDPNQTPLQGADLHNAVPLQAKPVRADGAAQTSTHSGSGVAPSALGAVHAQPLAAASAIPQASIPLPPPARRKWRIPIAAPSWLVSLVVHVALIVILAAVTLDPVQTAINFLNASTSADESVVEDFSIESPTLDNSLANATEIEPATPTFDSSETLTSITAPEVTMPSTLAASLESNTLTESILPTAVLGGVMAQMSTALNSRSANSKSEMLEQFGGTAASEKAVAMALKWLAEHQANDGGWSFDHRQICRNPNCPDHGTLAEARNGATAMALLPFLGAGQTHMSGQYQQTVKRGLAFLINRMLVKPGNLPTGSWWEDGGRTYSHGLASICVCEAYAMTGDPDLMQAAQLSLNYIIASQDLQGGGWRYRPGERGDTSVVGWCVMALKSGKMGHLVVPQETFQRTAYFLDFVSTNDGANYGYTRPVEKPRAATSSVGLLCRMYMGWEKDSDAIVGGVKYLSKRGPKTGDLYYSYYATQVMRQYGGPEWEKWNRGMRDPLIKLQVKNGHAAGSWYTKGPHAERGGRLMATSLATMILEVYYRHMPLYSEKTFEADFQL